MRSPPQHGPRNEQGFALLLVLWTLVTLSLIGTALLVGSKATTEQDTAETLLATAQAQADAAIQTALYHLLAEGSAHWAADGVFHTITESDLSASVRIQIETAKINPNIAPPGLLNAVFQTAGLQTAAAQTLARMVVLWRTPPSLTQQASRQATTSLLATLGACRPPGHPIRTLDEMSEIPGMTQPLLHTLSSHLSFTQKDLPSPQSRDPFLRAVFDHMQPQHAGFLLIQGGSIPPPAVEDTTTNWTDRTLIVTARVTRSGGYNLSRQAVVAPQLGHSIPFAFLSLETIRLDQM
ncbi:general secretion pathway protein K [Acetobacter indonesiensis NRIC 0313]|uniref:General secretion pathway protein K n=1 Tax=Acetobacter indonesiensis TaxID=104101 RepID=A0A252AMY7_9PROT|nr:type II secretion system protein GspK [Acetobacter indonesiensis]OUI91202.1 hypothetical protein HK17_12720 [Acetobacter indonesiensis]GAN63069.1 general secretion pathway protein K [Acetobacter indonesiensis]GBQ58599.1 general secretion pathway protein K [Acetobacter indonesiensis NRIC 0313]GEN04796.1 hypothetical protein AIN02nite_28210 [Acetobacter indonesiensis]